MNELLNKLNSDFSSAGEKNIKMIDVKTTEYSFSLSHIISLIQKNNPKICIISTSRNGESLLKELSNKTETKKILVLSGIKNETESNKIQVFEPQWEVNSLKESISFAVKNFVPEIFVFDSITNLTLFLSKSELSEFFEKFIGILKSRKIKGLFLNIVNETPEDIAIIVEGLMDERISLEKFHSKKSTGTMKIKEIQKKEEPKTQIKAPTQQQAFDVKELKKSITQIIREEAKKISEETKKNLEIKQEKKVKETKPKPVKKEKVFKLEQTQEKQKLLKKMELLEKSFELGVISEKAFEEGRRQIKEKLGKK